MGVDHLQHPDAHLEQSSRSDLSNTEIADALEELGSLYALDEADAYRVRAYRNAAASIRSCPSSVAALARQGHARQLPHVGETIEAKIIDLLQTGWIPATCRLTQRFPKGLTEIMRLPGIGPKRARLLYEQIGVDSLPALRLAAEQHRLRGIQGLSARFEQSVLEAIDAS
jgi:DNA polymerase (family 10)